MSGTLLLSALGFLLAMGLLAAARFCVRPAMTYRTWWVALVATELGHVGLLLAVGLACGMTWIGLRAADGVAVGLAVGTTIQALIAAVLFAWPVIAAWHMSRRVAAEIDATFFTAGTPTGKLWSWRRLWRWPNSVERGAVETFFAGETETERTPSAGLPIDFYRARAPMNRLSAGGDLPVPSVCVVVVHGGGWDSGDRAQLAAFNHWLAARGVAVAAVSYRLAPLHRWPAQREDLRAAVTWVRANAERLGVDADRLVLLGRSAGAQIAAATAYGAPLPGVRALVALYGCYDMKFVWSIRSATDSLNSDKLMQQFMGGGPEGTEAEQRYLSASAESLVNPGVPPTLILHGALDQLVWCRHSERLAAALARAGVRHCFVRFPWATHAGEANLHGPSGQLITGAVLRVALACTDGETVGRRASPSC